MASQHTLPPVPIKHSDFLKYLESNPDRPIPDLVQPFNEYDSVVRKIYAQEPNHPATAENLLNIVPLFDANGAADLKVRARTIATESKDVTSKYLMPLKDDQRRANGSPAVVPSLKQFQTNFNIFSESSLVDMDWSNVIAAGSAVTTSLLPVPEEFNDSKRGLRQFYHEQFAPASDVDLFLYGLTEKQAVEKIKQIERCIKDSILTETSTIRTKHAITIVSQYPTRHVQIVLRLYKSIAEILTGFDVDCSCAAYDGHQVYAAPRALGAYITQVNRVDLSRRSPSYENRLSKYSHRGFEVFWPDLDRARIDPTIFERSFTRTVGLARLLVLEKLPKSSDRDTYLAQRRAERGRPPNNNYRYSRKLRGNIKNDWEDEVAEWVEADEVSDYHTFTIPYGEKFHARKIEKLLYTKDLLLNAEWNKPKDREVHLHRHPAFFGDASDVMHDCCGYCPKPSTPEEEEVATEEAKIYVSGEISFVQDNPGRQEIGSFNPITDTDWTEMAYVGNTEGLCQAIVDHDLKEVEHWLSQEIDVNRRDHTGRTPLHLAAMESTPEIVQLLVDKGARMIWRLADGRTALHLAASRGSVEIVKILLTKSEQNEEEEANKVEARRKELRKKTAKSGPEPDAEGDIEMISNPSEDNDDADSHSYVTGSFVNVKMEDAKDGESTVPDDPNELEPDIYDINVLAWDTKASPLHLAIVKGHVDVVEELVTSFGADVLLPMKLLNTWDNSPKAAILTLLLAIRLPIEQAKVMTAKLLQLGASPAQGDIEHRTALHYLAISGRNELLDVYLQHDQPAVERAINYLAVARPSYNLQTDSVITAAINAKDVILVMKLLERDAKPSVSFDDYLKSAQKVDWVRGRSTQQNQQDFETSITQPLIAAVDRDLPAIAIELLARGADPNTLTTEGYKVINDNYFRRSNRGSSVLDYVQQKLVALRRYKGEPKTATKPDELNADDSVYLSEFVPGSYQMLLARNQLDLEREKYQRSYEQYQKQLEAESNREGLEEKKAAVLALSQEYEKLEADLLARGAQTFRELHPDIEEPANERNNKANNSAKKAEPWKIYLGFTVYNLTTERRAGYFKLFESAWTGDVDTIKELTLGMWGEDKKEFPLEVGVADSRDFSPFTIAVLRGHVEAAKTILAILIAQYKPSDDKKNTRYRIQNDDYSDDSCCDSDDDADSVQLETHIIDAEFTVEDVGETKTQVESKIKPLTVLQKRGNIHEFLEKSQRPKDHIANLIEYAIWKDDIEMLIFLLGVGQELTTKYSDQPGQSLFTVSQNEFLLALKLGRLRCLQELIKRTGAGLPLDKLAESSGVEIKENPKYYQGLTVHGKKRADWAARGGGMQVPTAVSMDPPLLVAAREGNLETVEWFLGTAPGRHYLEFAKAHKNDKRLRKLAKTSSGLERSILDWLNSRRDLVLHCAVLSYVTPQSERLVEYLVQNMPHCVEVKSVAGWTPLALAFRRQRLAFAKILLSAGANQTVRDSAGNNLLHLLLLNVKHAGKDSAKKLQSMLDLIDPLLAPSMLTQRSSWEPKSATPLAMWFAGARTIDAEYTLPVLQVILDFAEGTGQKHMELLDGTGNTPVHEAVKNHNCELLEALLARRPDLLYRENATGSTPADLAENGWIRQATVGPPGRLQSGGHNRGYYSYSYGARNLRSCSLLDDSPETVKQRVEETKSGVKESAAVRIYRMCCVEPRVEALNGANRKRKLVTLYDANEVAKRLATRNTQAQSYRRRRRNYYEEEEEDKGGNDEVGRWLFSC